MANEEQLKILKQGVEVWNRWREEHPDEEIDLSGANLTEANLTEADLTEATLFGADLSKANLSGAHLIEAALSKANLSEANLSKANLSGAHLSWAILSGAILSGAILVEATLFGADLSRADLVKANLSGVTLSRADLSGAALSGANLSKAALTETDLSETDLSGVTLVEVILNRAILSKATITGAILYGSARDGWIIDGIICDYVFWDVEGKEHTPKDRDFRPGEFEELYKQLPTFDYFFKHGFTALDAVVMSRIVEAINEQHPEFELKLDSFHSRGQPHAKFTVLHKEHIEVAKSQVTTDYESRIAALEGKQEQLMQIVSTLINQPQQIGEVIIGNKIITAGQDYFEHVQGNVEMQQAGGDIVQGDKVGGDSITTGVRGNIDLKGDSQQLAIGKNIQQRSSTVSKGGTVSMGDKHIGRDNIEVSGHAQVNQIKTGDSFQDQAQKLIQTPLPQMDQLNTKKEFTDHYTLLSEKLSELRKAYIIEADTEVKFKLKKKIEEAETDLTAIEQRLEALGQEKK